MQTARSRRFYLALLQARTLLGLSRAIEGAVTFRERLSPVLERVDGSSGAIGTAVNHWTSAAELAQASGPVFAAREARASPLGSSR